MNGKIKYFYYSTPLSIYEYMQLPLRAGPVLARILADIRPSFISARLKN